MALGDRAADLVAPAALTHEAAVAFQQARAG